MSNSNPATLNLTPDIPTFVKLTMADPGFKQKLLSAWAPRYRKWSKRGWERPSNEILTTPFSEHLLSNPGKLVAAVHDENQFESTLIGGLIEIYERAMGMNFHVKVAPKTTREELLAAFQKECRLSNWPDSKRRDKVLLRRFPTLLTVVKKLGSEYRFKVTTGHYFLRPADRHYGMTLRVKRVGCEPLYIKVTDDLIEILGTKGRGIGGSNICISGDNLFMDQVVATGFQAIVQRITTGSKTVTLRVH